MALTKNDSKKIAFAAARCGDDKHAEPIAVLDLCGRTVVLNYGQKLSEGTPRECVADPAVIEAYLGTDADVL